jgi:hypothetical protein
LTGIEFKGKDYPQTYLLADVKIDWSLSSDEAHIFTSPHGVLASFPLPGGVTRIIASKSDRNSKDQPSDGEIRGLVNSRGPEGAAVSELLWSSAFFIHSRIVDSLSRGRHFLVGDAAHIHSPALGQGMNTGIQDAANLAWKLALVVQGLADPSLLDSYNSERWPVENNVLKITDFVTNRMQSTNRMMVWLRDHLAHHLMANEHVAGQVMQIMSELSISYEDSDAVLSGHPSGSSLRAGDRAPDAVLDRDGAEIRLYELLRTGGHHLFIVGGATRGLADLGFTDGELTVHQVGDVPGALTDRNGEVAVEYGSGFAYLMRPDGYIGAIAEVDQVVDVLNEYAARIHLAARQVSA